MAAVIVLTAGNCGMCRKFKEVMQQDLTASLAEKNIELFIVNKNLMKDKTPEKWPLGAPNLFYPSVLVVSKADFESNSNDIPWISYNGVFNAEKRVWLPRTKKENEPHLSPLNVASITNFAANVDISKLKSKKLDKPTFVPTKKRPYRLV